MPNSTQKDGFFSDMIDKVLEEVGTFIRQDEGMGGQAKQDLRDHNNAIDNAIKELENTSPQDTNYTKKIFQK